MNEVIQYGNLSLQSLDTNEEVKKTGRTLVLRKTYISFDDFLATRCPSHHGADKSAVAPAVALNQAGLPRYSGSGPLDAGSHACEGG